MTVAQISAGYSPEFSALFGRCWSSALAALTTRAPRSVSTAFSSGPREQFSASLPQLALLLPDALDPNLVDKGKRIIEGEVRLREKFAEEVRAGMPPWGSLSSGFQLAFEPS